MKILLWIDRLHWLWLLLAAPLMLFPGPRRSLILLVVPGLWIVHWFALRAQQSAVNRHSSFSLHHSAFPITPLNSAILLIAIMVLVSTWATYDLAFSLPKISGMVLALGTYFAIVRLSERPRGWWLSLMFFLASGVAIAALGLLGTNWFSSKFPFLNTLTGRLPRLISGLQGAESGFHPNQVAGTLAWVLPAMLVLSVSLRVTRWSAAIASKRSPDSPSHRGRGSRGLREWGLRVLLWLGTLFVAGVFVLTQSRGAYIGMALACLGMFFLALPRRGRWITLGALMIAGLAAGVALRQVGWEPVQNWVMSSPLAEGSGLSLNTLEGRLEIWSRAIYGLQDFPFTGMGMNTFREVVHVLYPLFLVAPDVDIGHAHNEFLQAGLDLGLPGLIAFMALYLGSFWMLVSVWNHRPSDTQPLTFNLQRTIVLGLGGGLFAHLIYGLTDAVTLGAKPGFVFWLLLGLIAGLYGQVFSAPGDTIDVA